MKNAERYGRTTRRASFLWVAVLLAACGGPADQPSAEVAAVVLPEGAVPLEYDGHIRFEATVGDSVPARLLFDTGAAGLYLDSLWQERSGIGAETRTETWMAAGAGTQPVRCGVLFDEITFRMDTIVHTSRMTPLLDFRGMLGRGSDGIFGLQYMAGYCVEFDLKEGWMRAVSPDTLRQAGFVRYPLEEENGRLYLPVRVRAAGREVEGRFLLDTGSPGTLSMTGAGWGAVSCRPDAVLYRTISGGVGGSAASLCLRADSVWFCGSEFAGVPVDVSLNRTGALSRTDMVGIVGNGLLERFSFAIDFGAPALWVRPRAEAGKPFDFVTPGFSAIDRTDIMDGWLVTGLFDGHAPQGMQPGDIIVSCDGVRMVDSAAADTLWKASGRHELGIVRGGVSSVCTAHTKEIL